MAPNRKISFHKIPWLTPTGTIWSIFRYEVRIRASQILDSDEHSTQNRRSETLKLLFLSFLKGTFLAYSLKF